MGFSHPSWRQFAEVNHAQNRVPHFSRLLREACPERSRRVGVLTSTYRFHNLAGAICRSIIHRDHFVIAVVKFEKLDERLLDRFFFIASGNDDGNFGVAGSRAGGCWTVPFRLGDIDNAGHADRGVHYAREPRQREDSSRDPMKVSHSSYVFPASIVSFALSIPTNGANFIP